MSNVLPPNIWQLWALSYTSWPFSLTCLLIATGSSQVTANWHNRHVPIAQAWPFAPSLHQFCGGSAGSIKPQQISTIFLETSTETLLEQLAKAMTSGTHLQLPGLTLGVHAAKDLQNNLCWVSVLSVQSECLFKVAQVIA